MRSKYYTKDGKLKPNKCGHCSKFFTSKTPHRCNGQRRKHKIKWTTYSEDEIIIMSIE